LANGESFIRFHRPDKYGDNLMDFRESVRLANTEKRYVTGFEEGRIFNGFRYVYPVFYNGEHLGSFEVSFDFDAIRRVMVDYTDSYIFLALRKDVVDKKVFADEKSNYKPCCINKDFVVARKDSLMSGVAERGHVNFEENLDHIRSHMKAMSEFSEIANAGEELIITHFLPIKNVKGEKVAYIIATSKGLEALVLSYVFYLKIIGGAALLIVLLFLWNGKMDSLNCKLKIQTEELNKLAVLDGLTGVFNRRKSEIFVETEFDRVKRYKSTFSILMLDIDFFKEVNDKYGHSVGDSVLVEFCQVVQKNIRSVDILGRWGGEEFVIISPETDEEKAVIFANGIKDKIANHSFEHIGGLTVSIGLSSYSADDESYDQVLQRADEAMYKSKETGRNTVNRA
jgi:diguanylate cyclase (GGDEF)-like protein